ncbi:hypothetical protein COCCADRAFT_103806, partial [Bipolaris zeicola 26-R-13]
AHPPDLLPSPLPSAPKHPPRATPPASLSPVEQAAGYAPSRRYPKNLTPTRRRQQSPSKPQQKPLPLRSALLLHVIPRQTLPNNAPIASIAEPRTTTAAGPARRMR